ncbi:MAG TPA: phospholipase, partial [Streptosporangiaceae bacterium]
DLRLRLWREHLDRAGDDLDDLLDPVAAFTAFRAQAERLAIWHAAGRAGPRPPGRVMPHRVTAPSAVQRVWAAPLYRAVYDPDGRPWRDRWRGRL